MYLLCKSCVFDPQTAEAALEKANLNIGTLF